jgi:hypothetical protein
LIPVHDSFEKKCPLFPANITYGKLNWTGKDECIFVPGPFPWSCIRWFNEIRARILKYEIPLTARFAVKRQRVFGILLKFDFDLPSVRSILRLG